MNWYDEVQFQLDVRLDISTISQWGKQLPIEWEHKLYLLFQSHYINTLRGEPNLVREFLMSREFFCQILLPFNINSGHNMTCLQLQT